MGSLLIYLITLEPMCENTINIKYMSGEEVHRELKRQYLEYGEIIKTLKIGKYKEK